MYYHNDGLDFCASLYQLAESSTNNKMHFADILEESFDILLDATHEKLLTISPEQARSLYGRYYALYQKNLLWAAPIFEQFKNKQPPQNDEELKELVATMSLEWIRIKFNNHLKQFTTPLSRQFRIGIVMRGFVKYRVPKRQIRQAFIEWLGGSDTYYKNAFKYSVHCDPDLEKDDNTFINSLGDPFLSLDNERKNPFPTKYKKAYKAYQEIMEHLRNNYDCYHLHKAK